MIARVYQAINTIAAELAHDGVAKTRLNTRNNYLYRSIDDVLERLAPLLAQHKLCVLPRVLEREATDRVGDSGELLISVMLKVAFDLVSAEDGSCHTIEAYGEALDAGDKATPKAMQSAYKYAVLQAFCIPAVQGEDADARSHRLGPGVPGLVPEPAEGWQRWSDELAEKARICSDAKALECCKADARPHLASLQRANPSLYRQVGDEFPSRARELEGAGFTAQSTTMAHPAHGAPAASVPLAHYAPTPSASAEEAAHLAPTAPVRAYAKAHPAPTARPASSKAQDAPVEPASSPRLAHPSPGGTTTDGQETPPPPPSPSAGKRAQGSPIGGPSPAARCRRRAAAPPPLVPSHAGPNGSGAHG